MVIEPAVRLTEEVLWAANRTLTVKKVVMTSSIGDAQVTCKSPIATCVMALQSRPQMEPPPGNVRLSCWMLRLKRHRSQGLHSLSSLRRELKSESLCG